MIHAERGRAATGRAQRRRQRKVEAILREAGALVGEAGVSALKIKPLADRLDCAVGAVYRYFPSKEAILAALEEQAIHAVGRGLQAAIEGLRALPQAKRLGAGRRALACALLAPRFYVAFQAAEPARFGLLQRLLGEPEPVLREQAGAPAYQAALRTLGALATQLDEAATHRALEPGSAPERALLLWASVHGVAQLQKLARYDPTRLRPDAQALAVATSLLRGWGAKRPALAAARKLADTLDLHAALAASRDHPTGETR